MNLYEHTIIARQDTSPAQIKQLTEKYTTIVEKNEGEIVQTEQWGLLNLAYIIKTPSYLKMTDGPDGRKALKIRGIISELKSRALKKLTKDKDEPLMNGLKIRIENAKKEKKINLNG